MSRSTAWILHDEAKAGKAIAVPLNADAKTVPAVCVFSYAGKPVERAGIEGFRWHDLRHTWASWHVQSGTSLQELMELGGWSTMEMVMRYAHLAADHLQRAASRIDGTFSSQHRNVVPLRSNVSA